MAQNDVYDHLAHQISRYRRPLYYLEMPPVLFGPIVAGSTPATPTCRASLPGHALVGDPQLFARADSVEETWRIVQPLLDDPPPVRPYQSGSWGAGEAESLARGHQRWHRPWLDGHT